MSTHASLWPFLAVYLAGAATGALAAGLIAWTRISDLRHENTLLRAGLAGAIRASIQMPPLRVAARALPFVAAAAAAAVGLFGLASESQAQQPAPTVVSQTVETSRDDNALAYCRNIASAASDARFARQAQSLAAMEKEIETRIAQLEAKRAEYQDWLARREAFLKKADEALIAVISQMRPDAAAAQISVMADEAAAAILAKLNPRSASAIMNEMEPARAASLTNTMVGISRRAQTEGRS